MKPFDQKMSWSPDGGSRDSVRPSLRKMARCACWLLVWVPQLVPGAMEGSEGPQTASHGTGQEGASGVAAEHHTWGGWQDQDWYQGGSAWNSGSQHAGAVVSHQEPGAEPTETSQDGFQDPLQVHDPWSGNGHSHGQSANGWQDSWMATAAGDSTTPPAASGLAAASPAQAATTLTASTTSGLAPLPAPTASGLAPLSASTASGLASLSASTASGLAPLSASTASGLASLTTPMASGLASIPEGTQSWQDHQWNQGWSGWNWRWSSGNWQGSGDWSDGNAWNGSYKGDFSDPPSWPGWSHRRYWVQAVTRWNKGSDIPVPKRAEKVLRALGWEMQPDFEHLPEAVLMSSAYLEVIIEIINNKAGVREDDERRRAYRAAIVEGQRKREETLSQYAMRRLRDFNYAASFGVSVPNEFKAILLKEGASLSDQNLQNLTSMLGDREQDPDAVAKALSRLDIRADRMSAFSKSSEAASTFVSTHDSGGPDDGIYDDQESSEEESGEDDGLVKELEPLDLTEDQVHQVFAVLESREYRPKKRTWKQNKEFKASLKRDRGSFTKGDEHRPKAHHHGRRPRGRPNKEQLKKITRCNLCLQKGHWAEDCTAGQKGGAPKKASLTAFSYSSSSASGTSAFTFAQWNALQDLLTDGGCFLTIPSGEAIVDIGATQDLIGGEALAHFEKILAQLGLRVIKVDAPLVVPSGIGGAAHVTSVVLVPIAIGGHAGVLEMTVLKESIPPLLSVGFLDFLGSIINLPENSIHFGRLKCTVPLKKLGTGHRSIELFSWQDGEEFPVPIELKEKYQLEDKAFNAQVPSAYTKERRVDLHCFLEQPNEPNTMKDLDTALVGHKGIDEATSSLTTASSCCELVRESNLDEYDVDLKNHVNMSKFSQHTVKPVDDSECRKASGSAEPMGNSSSPRSTQFASLCPRRCDGVRAGGDTAWKQVAAADACYGRKTGSQPHPLQAACHCRDSHQESSLEPHGVSAERLTKSCEVPAPDQSGGVKIQPICRVVDVRSVQGTTDIPIQERITHCSKSQAEGKRSGPDSFPCASTRLSSGRDHRACCGEPGCAEQSTGHHSQPNQPVLARVGARTEPDGADGGLLSTSGAEFGSRIQSMGFSHVGCKPKYRATRLAWPRWMVTSTFITASSWLTWENCSESMQARLLSMNHGPESIIFHFDLLESGHLHRPRQDPAGLHEGGKECHRSAVLRGPTVCQDAASLPDSKVCPDEHSSSSPELPTDPGEGTCQFDRCYLDLGEEGGLQGNTGCFETSMSQWIPKFLQHRSESSSSCSSVASASDNSWETLWIQILDKDSKEILENGPCCCESFYFSQPRNVVVTRWGLPKELLNLLTLSDPDSSIDTMDVEGNSTDLGPFWVIRASNWNNEIKEESDDDLQFLQQEDVTSQSNKSGASKHFTWLAQKMVRDSGESKLDLIELFSPHRVLPYAKKLNLRVDENQCFDLTGGWDVRKKQHRTKFRSFRKKTKPMMVMASPECRAFTQWRHMNEPKMCPRQVIIDREEGELQWNFSLETAEDQVKDGHHFGLEHPAGASTWSLPRTQRLLSRKDVALMTFDQCQFGLQVSPSGLTSRKSTKIATSNPWLAVTLLNAQCQREHEHAHLEGGLTKPAQVYPPAMCQAIAESVQSLSLGLPCPSLIHWSEGELERSPDQTEVNFYGDEAELEDEGDRPSEIAEDQLPPLTSSQRRLVQKIHVNTGHPDRVRMMRALKAAGAKPQVLKFVRDEFQCEDCNLKQLPDNRRRAQLPRTFAFNKVVSIDFLYVHYQGLKIPVFNMVCVGTSYQVAVRAPVPEGSQGGTPTSALTWKLFAETWLRYFGAPQVVICDAGNEFKALFERNLELTGCYQHVIHPESPWENAKAERHGGWLKNRLDSEIHGGRCIFTSLSEFDEFLASLTSTKNRWLSRGGYTPSQLVFGHLPRVPGELLAEDELGNAGLADAYEDPLEVDEAAGEYRRAHRIREKARQMALQQASRDAIGKAQRSAHHQSRQWTPGQWVYVFRRAKQNQDLHLRDRWVGPGIVVAANNDTVYIGMRTRLWRCSKSQIRAALPNEVLGRELMSDPGLAELLRQVVSGSQAGAVDVAREGPPPPERLYGPVQRLEDGVDIPQAPIPISQEPETPVEQARLPIPPQLVGPRQPAVDDEVIFPREERVSRRSSVEEPQAEPPTPMIEDEAVFQPGLPPIPEVPGEADDMTVPEPPFKLARTEAEQQGSSSSSGTRAPGTPISDLMGRVVRNQPAASTPHLELPPGLTDLTQGPPPSPGDVWNDDDDEQLLTFQTEGWSGTYFNYSLGSQTLCFDKHQNGTFVTAPKRNGEISLKELNQQEKCLFDESDKLEWKAILKTKAVHVVHGKEAEKMRRMYPERVLSSRMVRRKKPQPELHSWKAKSRWCLHGHSDPDTGSLTTYAPTPQAESIAMFLQASLNLKMKLAFGDVKNAFCQSLKLQRPNGPLFAEPCEGLKLPAGALIVIDVPVYGLDDAPAAWRATVVNFLTESLNFQRNLVEPCWYSLYDEAKQCIAQVMIEVDDFIIAAVPAHYNLLHKQLTERFTFGKWECDEAEYAGRHIRCTPDCIFIDQAKYIIEQLSPIKLAKGRRQQKDSKLNAEEFNLLRSLTFKCNWLGRETRPEAAGLASIMASRLPHATVEDVAIINKFVNYLRSTADRPLKIWRFDPEDMAFIVISDAGGISMKGATITDSEGLPADATQGAWMVLASEGLPKGKTPVKASPITWRSSKLKRKVFSTFGGETQAMLQGINEVDWLQIMYRDAVFHDVQLAGWRNSLSPHMLVLRGECEMGGRQQQCSVTDAKSLFDCLLRENPSGRQDRKSALELAIVLRDLQSTKSMVRWVPHQKMIVDVLTKLDPAKANDALNHFLKSGWLCLVDVSEEMAHRKSDMNYRRRSHSASEKRLQAEYEANASQLFGCLLANISWGNCESMPKDVMKPFDQKMSWSPDGGSRDSVRPSLRKMARCACWLLVWVPQFDNKHSRFVMFCQLFTRTIQKLPDNYAPNSTGSREFVVPQRCQCHGWPWLDSLAL